jgi:HAMP domain-containing protein
MSNFQSDDAIWKTDIDDVVLAELTFQTIGRLNSIERAIERVAEGRPILNSDAPSSREERDQGEPDTAEWLAMDTSELRTAIESLNKAVKRIKPSNDPRGQGELHGTISVFEGRAAILRGHVDRLRNLPVIRTADPFVLQLILKLPKFGAKIKRENHAQFGIHYHYLDSDEMRSDTILCFRTVDTKSPLFSEPHAVKGASFFARPESWRVQKRASVFNVLEPELKRFAANEFRRPSAEAKIVWRNGATTIDKL